jgi:hypothetical protein
MNILAPKVKAYKMGLKILNNDFIEADSKYFDQFLVISGNQFFGYLQTNKSACTRDSNAKFRFYRNRVQWPRFFSLV